MSQKSASSVTGSYKMCYCDWKLHRRCSDSLISPMHISQIKTVDEIFIDKICLVCAIHIYIPTHTHTFFFYLLCVHIHMCVHAIVFNKISYVQLTKRRVHCFNISKQYILQLKDFGKNKNTIVEVQIAWEGTLGVRIVVQNKERECLSLFSFVYVFFCFYKDLIWFLKKHTEWKRIQNKGKM